MKIHTTIIAGAIFGLLAFSACEAGTVPSTETPSQPQDNQTGVSTAGTVDIQQSQEPALSEADLAAYSGAQQLKDPTFCDKIKDEVLKKNCNTDITDGLTLELAKTNADLSLCQKLSTPDKQEACKINIEVLKTQEQASMDRQRQSETAAKLSNEIAGSKDVSRCKELKEENYIMACEYDILINQAFANRDKQICSQASDQATIERCTAKYDVLLQSSTEM